jgi:hypothetical protein
VDVAGFLSSLEASGLADRIRLSEYLFPLIESLHVLGLTMVFGTIAIIDLRLLGLAGRRRPCSLGAGDTLKWTWVAFAITATTGVLMFITNARVYFDNIYFELKMAAIVLAGINMAVFEVTSHRVVHRWDHTAAPPAGRAAAVLSLVLWVSIIFMGRWIGFTTTHATATPDLPANIEDLLPK